MIHTGDCIEVMAGMEADSVDAVVTDPPYGLEFMGKRWDAFRASIESAGPTESGVFAGGGRSGITEGRGTPNLNAPRYVAGHPFQTWCEQWAREALRVTKPGGYLLAFGGTRTHHRLVCGLEDAGWIIRDELDWIYASGFPKGKANLKPAHEPIVLARKPGPLRPLGIEACRIGYTSEADSADVAGKVSKNPTGKAGLFGVPGIATFNEGGRWPSNVLLEDAELFDDPNPYVVGSGATSEGFSGGGVRKGGDRDKYRLYGDGEHSPYHNDSGGYSRFFIIPKADRAEREPVVRGQKAKAFTATMNDGIGGREHNPEQPTAWRENSHPTVKPLDLMRHLVRLVTPIGGTVLDPFLGSGTTAIAAEMEGFAWIGIEREAEYVAIAEARLNGTQRGLGLDVPAPTRKPITGRGDGKDWSAGPVHGKDGVTGFVNQKPTGRHYADGPARAPRPPKPTPATARLFDEEPAA
jgi:DNA modification methylase